MVGQEKLPRQVNRELLTQLNGFNCDTELAMTSVANAARVGDL